MKIGELFRDREADIYPTKDEIVQREIAAAHGAFPNANGDDLTALALAASSLRRSMAERTNERDFLHQAFEEAMKMLAADRKAWPLNARLFMARLRDGGDVLPPKETAA